MSGLTYRPLRLGDVSRGRDLGPNPAHAFLAIASTSRGARYVFLAFVEPERRRCHSKGHSGAEEARRALTNPAWRLSPRRNNGNVRIPMRTESRKSPHVALRIRPISG